MESFRRAYRFEQQRSVRLFRFGTILAYQNAVSASDKIRSCSTYRASPSLITQTNSRSFHEDFDGIERDLAFLSLNFRNDPSHFRYWKLFLFFLLRFLISGMKRKHSYANTACIDLLAIFLPRIPLFFFRYSILSRNLLYE